MTRAAAMRRGAKPARGGCKRRSSPEGCQWARSGEQSEPATAPTKASAERRRGAARNRARQTRRERPRAEDVRERASPSPQRSGAAAKRFCRRNYGFCCRNYGFRRANSNAADNLSERLGGRLLFAVYWYPHAQHRYLCSPFATVPYLIRCGHPQSGQTVSQFPNLRGQSRNFIE